MGETQTLEGSWDEALAAVLFFFAVVLPKTLESSLTPVVCIQLGAEFVKERCV